MNRLRVGDDVVVISGNDKNKRGRVTKLLPNRNAVLVSGVNVVKRHVKANQQQAGGILEVEAPIHESKVMPVDPATGNPTRVRIKLTDGAKVRLAKSGAVIPSPQQKSAVELSSEEEQA